MDRHWDTNGAASAPTAPVNVLGPNVYPQGGSSPSNPGPWWYHMITEEMRNVVVEGSLTPARGTLTQLKAAITAMIAAQAPPVGTIIDYAGTTAPAGYLACPTSATNISRTTYAALFAAIGTTWGAGDGSTTFGMPWFPPDYAAIQANANVGSQSVGAVISHSHAGTVTSPGQTGASGSAVYVSTGAAFTGAAGGSANLAAGQRILKCVKY